eukprot:5576879-Pyramimonas_sp.AAC.2
MPIGRASSSAFSMKASRGARRSGRGPLGSLEGDSPTEFGVGGALLAADVGAGDRCCMACFCSSAVAMRSGRVCRNNGGIFFGGGVDGRGCTGADTGCGDATC